MNDRLALSLVFLIGGFLSTFFFGGLWYTVQKGVTSKLPAVWFLGSLLLRTGVVLAGFYFVVAGALVETRCVPARICDGARDCDEVAHASRRRASRLKWTRGPALRLSPDELVFWRYGYFVLNSTIVTTWALMLVVTVGAMLITRRLATEDPISRWQGFLEIVVTTIQKQIQEVGLHHPEKYLGFIGTLFLFIAVSNLFAILPGYEPPTGSLSTTSAWRFRSSLLCNSSELRSKG